MQVVRTAVAGAEPRATQLAAAFRRLPGLCVWQLREGDLDHETISREDVDAFVIARPLAVHAALIHSALRAGKHVWIEVWPVGSVAVAGGLAREAGEAGCMLFVHDPWRYAPVIGLATEIIRTGELGQVQWVIIERRTTPLGNQAADAWRTLGAEALDTLERIVPAHVNSLTLAKYAYFRPGQADVAVCNLVLDGQVAVHLYVSQLHPSDAMSLTVIGTDGTMTCASLRELRPTLQVHSLRDGSVWRTVRPAEPYAPAMPAADALAATDFVDSIRTGRQAVCSIDRTLAVHRLLEEADGKAIGGDSL